MQVMSMKQVRGQLVADVRVGVTPLGGDVRTTVRISQLDDQVKPLLEQLHRVITQHTTARLSDALDTNQKEKVSA